MITVKTCASVKFKAIRSYRKLFINPSYEINARDKKFFPFFPLRWFFQKITVHGSTRKCTITISKDISMNLAAYDAGEIS